MVVYLLKVYVLVAEVFEFPLNSWPGGEFVWDEHIQGIILG
jgi:hypothetical protein